MHEKDTANEMELEPSEIGPGLVPHWLSCLKSFTTIIFYYVG